ncbi:MAG: oligosaccharide flippase family protein [Bacteroidales bacterium]|nr:oligosaccharide flippase family protein [Bacteroidales bacterium]MDD4672431.1 oligosaccharide flippase family protein [Bacteroidales bacterium]MDY0347295.1 oligosaccharide flippase family protein [Tenuifilaceae bacterium]
MRKNVSKYISKIFPDKEFLRNFLTLFTGSTLGQFIPFVAGPLLARLYVPADFGLYALLSSTAGLASLVATGSYEFAILTSDTDDEADSLSLLSSLLSFIFSCVATLILFLMVVFAKPWTNSAFGYTWFLVPLFVVFQGVLNATGYRLNRQQKYGVMARGRLLRAAVMTSVQLLLGFLSLPWGLFPGMLTGHFSAAAYQLRSVRCYFHSAFRSFTIKNIKVLAAKYYRFPAFLMPAQLVNELSIQTPVFLLKSFFSTSAVGFYALPQKFLNAPVALIGNSIGQVFFQKAVEQKKHSESLAATTLSLFRFLFRIGVVPFSIMLVFGDSVFVWLFGDQWVQSGLFAQMLSPWLLFVLSGSPISKLFTVLDKQHQSLWLNLVLLTLRVAGLIAGALFFSSQVMAVFLFSLLSFLYWVFLTFYILRLAKVKVLPIIIETVVTWTIVVLPMVIVRYWLM